ncbi:hypothetical protein GQ602_001189 [Ophiocordyceps camponoti-floridani]|uniref:Clr5 domain-containing protein n=1 Tax=Ophiocordyceps camponoti-floridani TaxID=2030778 RepID=A0A8H4VH71_9HYPO|nr:hypothetical protein GQ602_001189 [Ophiocordyceps camponoti-floridani]
MDNLKKWGVRKNRRKVVVLDQTADMEKGHHQQLPVANVTDDEALGQPPAHQQAVQSLVLPYHHQKPLQEQQPQQASHDLTNGWGFFAHSRWPCENTGAVSPYARHQVDGQEPQTLVENASPSRRRRLNAGAAPGAPVLIDDSMPTDDEESQPYHWMDHYTLT